MGFLSNLASLFTGLTDFFTMLRQMFGALPLVCQVLIYFGFGGFLLIALVQMLRDR